MAIGSTLTRIIGTVIAMVVALAMTPTVMDAVYEAQQGNITNYSSADSLMNLVPLFYVLTVIGIGVVSIAFFLKNN